MFHLDVIWSLTTKGLQLPFGAPVKGFCEAFRRLKAKQPHPLGTAACVVSVLTRSKEEWGWRPARDKTDHMACLQQQNEVAQT